MSSDSDSGLSVSDDDFNETSLHNNFNSPLTSDASSPDFVNSQLISNQDHDEAVDITSSETGSPNVDNSLSPDSILTNSPPRSLHSSFVPGQVNHSSEADFSNLDAEIEDLFVLMNNFTPQDVELEIYLRPFIPEYIPAVGDIDSFIKPPRPDEKQESLGILVLDEPELKQSDPVVLELQLRSKLKTSGNDKVVVGKIENAEKNTRHVSEWIHNIEEIHHSLPPPSVVYSRKMPDLENLMQVWPPHIESILDKHDFPPPDAELDIASYLKFACLLLDIPVYDDPIESAHLLFSLYSEFKSNQHFQEI
ncbi:hypothetical protein GEMRC1_008559 [Eukaryota sp. GEM-RC1]